MTSTDKATAAYSAITTQLESWLTTTSTTEKNKNLYNTNQITLSNANNNNEYEDNNNNNIVEKQCKSLEIFLKKRSLSYDIITKKKIDIEYLNECEHIASTYSHDECDLWKLIKLLRDEDIGYLSYDSSARINNNDSSNVNYDRLGIYSSSDDIVNTILLNNNRNNDDDDDEVNVYHRRCILLKWIQSSLDKKLSWNIFPPSSQDTMWPCTMKEIKNDGNKSLELDGFVLVDKKDARKEEELTNCIWCCIQAGNIDKAKDVCVNTGQAWRAASYDINRNWDDYFLKKMNYNLASNALQEQQHVEKKYVLYEIAIYGLLGNNPKACLPSCTTWQKAVQVYLYCMVQRLEDEILSKFNTNIVRSASTMFPMKTTYPDAEVQLLQSTNQLGQLTELNMFRELAKLYKVTDVQALQSCVAIGTQSILDYVTTYQEREDVSSSILAHFVIFYNTLIPDIVPLDVYKNIILDYIHGVLVPTDSYWPHVALYTSLLPDNEVIMNTYASFLINIQDMQYRSIVLQKAREHFTDGLDIFILKQVVDQIFNDNVTTTDDINNNNTSIHQSILNKMQAVLWFTYYPDHHMYALQYANLFLKTCILQNQIYPCQVFLQEYFSSFQNTIEDDNSIFQEHEMIRFYIVGITEYENFMYTLERFEKDATGRTSSSIGNYNALLRTAYVTEQQLMKIIQYPNGWMNFPKNNSNEQNNENALIQCKCLPHVVNMIHTVCANLGKYCNDEKEKLDWLYKAVKVIKFVASEDHGLFNSFNKVDLEKVLVNSMESYITFLRCSGN